MNSEFSLVVATYNVAPYLPDFLGSLEAQTYGVNALDIVLVDDGSTDGSGGIVRRWAEGRPNVRVLHQENAGQGAARNAGLRLASGRWVTFVDPDDILAADYFERVATFLGEKGGDAALLATKILTFTDDHGVRVDRHPLRSNFKGDDKIVDLERFPDRIHISGGSSFLRMQVLRENSLEFDPRIRPTFEDGHLIGRYLLCVHRPLVGFIRSAEYYYRKRIDQSSSVQAGWASHEKYTTVLRLGYLDLLRSAIHRYGHVPEWLQNVVLYELFWFFRADLMITSYTGSLPESVTAEFHALVSELFGYLDVDTVRSFAINSSSWELRQALLATYLELPVEPDVVWVDAVEKGKNLVRARYWFSGPAPDEEVRYRGQVVAPRHEKTRCFKVYGRVLLRERILWLPADGTLRVRLNGRVTPIRFGAPTDDDFALMPTRLYRRLGVRPPDADIPEVPQVRSSWASRLPIRRKKTQAEADQAVARRAKRRALRRQTRERFADAWVLFDRLDLAGDNAEHLQRYLQRRRPEVNAYYVLERSSKDWPRLKAEGFRLIAHGSMEWRELLLNAKFVISSHANGFAEAPLPVGLYGGRRFRFVFLQHGVTKDDLSRWLNPKRIHLMLAATPQEFEAFCGDETPYVLTTKEVALTGFPRHDRLLGLAARSDAMGRRVFVMPTWRRSLAERLKLATAEEQQMLLRSSAYAIEWSAALHALQEDHESNPGFDIRVLLHPNMAAHAALLELPPGITMLSWDSVDLQRELATCSLLVTDYSSIAFDAALVDKPVVYFQFDQTEFFSGLQPFRRGYFDYETDGFGAVVETAEGLRKATAEIAGDSWQVPALYRARAASAFTLRDGNACSRVYRAIVALDQRERPVLSATEGDAPGR